MTPRHLISILLLMFAVLLPPAAAEEPSVEPEKPAASPEVERALTLQQEGVQHLQANRLAEAIGCFQGVVEIFRRELGEERETAEALAWLAQALERAGRSEDALLAFQESVGILRRVLPEDDPTLVSVLTNMSLALVSCSRHEEALELQKELLAVQRRLHEGDHEEVAASTSNLGVTLDELGRHQEALALHEDVLAMRRRLYEGDHMVMAISLNNLAATLSDLSRNEEALPLFEEALAMRRRLLDGDNFRLVRGLNNLAAVYTALGRHAEAILLQEEALAMARRLFPQDHPSLAWSLMLVVTTYDVVGRHEEALALCTEAVAMYRRLVRGDHPRIAWALDWLASIYSALGRMRDVLSIRTESLAMKRRLFPGDNPRVAHGLSNLGTDLLALGRPQDAVPLIRESLGMHRRLDTSDRLEVAVAMSNLATALQDLGRRQEGLEVRSEQVAMLRRIFTGDHLRLAMGIANLAVARNGLARHGDALPLADEALEMRRRVFEGDHPDTAMSLHNVAFTLEALGGDRDGLSLYEDALAMRRRLFLGAHESTANTLTALALAYERRGRVGEALATLREAVAMDKRIGQAERHQPLAYLGRMHVRAGRAKEALAPLTAAVEHLEARRSDARGLGAAERAQYVGEMRRWDPYPLLVQAHLMLGESEEAFATLERGRGRELLDLLERGRTDTLGDLAHQARTANDAETLAEITKVKLVVEDTERAVILAERGERKARESGQLAPVREAAKAAAAARKALEEALASRARLVRETVPEAKVRTLYEIQGHIAPGEAMLCYSLNPAWSDVFVVGAEAINAHTLPLGEAALTEMIAAHLALISDEDEDIPLSLDLLHALVPEELWKDLREYDRLYVVGHGATHTLPFEALVVGEKEGKPVYWLDEGPPISYVASGSLHVWLAKRREEQRASRAEPSLVALGDPVFVAPPPIWPEEGALIISVTAGSQASELGIRAGDVLVAYDGKAIPDLAALGPAIRGAAGAEKEIEIRMLRQGLAYSVSARPGSMGVRIANEPPPVSGPAFLAGSSHLAEAANSSLRSRRLGALPGTRLEVGAIEKSFKDAHENARLVTLLGADATEANLFAASPGARILHLATHGIPDETITASFSRLALTVPLVPVPGDDGFLTLLDLLDRWRERLAHTELVVLSACETQRGRLQRHEGVVALPWGFHFAGCPTVVASLWQVSDESTPLLMADFYERLAKSDGEDRLDALLAARKALRQTHPHPFHWAPFVLLGDPR